MSNAEVSLDEHTYMSHPANASSVYDAVSTGTMPPGDSGEPRWPPDKVQVFKAWMDGGYQA